MPDLLHQCQNAQWAESVIESLTAENARLRGQIDAGKSCQRYDAEQIWFSLDDSTMYLKYPDVLAALEQT